MTKTTKEVRRRRKVRTDAVGADRSTGRTKRGTFAKGNRLSVNRPSPNDPWRAAIRSACSPEQLGAVVRALVREARGGDVHAAQVLLDRVLGKPRTEVADVGGIVLGDLTTTTGCAETTRAVLERVAAGTLSIEDGERLVGIVDFHRAAVEAVDLEKQLRDVRRQLAEYRSGAA